jgi:hypothetical protein
MKGLTGKMTLLADVSSECKWIARTQPIIATLAKCWSRTSVIKPWPSPGVIDLHDRHTQGGRLALAEATVPQIATFTGHSLKDVEAILDAHYLGRDIQLAEAAVLKLEQRTKL